MVRKIGSALISNFLILLGFFDRVRRNHENGKYCFATEGLSDKGIRFRNSIINSAYFKEHSQQIRN